MIIFWLSLALWFLCGIQAFVIFVRKMAKTTFDNGFGEGMQPSVRLQEKQWQVRFDNCWTDIGAVFTVHAVLGLGMLIYRLGEGGPPLQFNLGFRFVARDILPLEIARKLEGEEKAKQSQAAPAAPSPQQLTGLLQQTGLAAQMLQQGLPQPQSQQLGLQGFGQPPSKP